MTGTIPEGCPPSPRKNRIPDRVRFFCSRGFRPRLLLPLVAAIFLPQTMMAVAVAASQPAPVAGLERPLSPAGNVTAERDAGQPARFPEGTAQTPSQKPAQQPVRHTAYELAQQLAQRDSATATLQRHCAQPITAHLLDQHSPHAMEDDARRLMQASPQTTLAIRHVLLHCGAEIYSEAWNLYLPDRLTPRSRHLLQNGHTPFGRAVGERNFQRIRLISRFEGLPPAIVLENRALLRRRSDGAGFSYLIERYTQASVDGLDASSTPRAAQP